MYRPFACEAIFLLPYSADVSGGSVLRRAAHALGTFRGKPFAPRASRTAAFLNGDDGTPRITFEHPDFGAANGCADSNLSLGVGADFGKGLDLVLLTVQLGREGEQIEQSWAAACAIAPRIVTALSPAYAFANGKDIDNERSSLPSAKALEPSFPSALTPFTYLGADAVGEGQRGMLSAVSAHRSEPLADGWMLQPVAALDDAPPPGFLSDCEAIAGHALRYLRPLTGRK